MSLGGPRVQLRKPGRMAQQPGAPGDRGRCFLPRAPPEPWGPSHPAPLRAGEEGAGPPPAVVIFGFAIGITRRKGHLDSAAGGDVPLTLPLESLEIQP